MGDLTVVFQSAGKMIAMYLNMRVSIGKVNVSVGTIYLWCACAIVLIIFIRGIGE